MNSHPDTGTRTPTRTLDGHVDLIVDRYAQVFCKRHTVSGSGTRDLPLSTEVVGAQDRGHDTDICSETLRNNNKNVKNWRLGRGMTS